MNMFHSIMQLVHSQHLSLYAVALVSFFTGFLPTIGIEVYLAYTALKVKLFAVLISIAFVAAISQMLSKTIIYGMGAKGGKILPNKHRDKLLTWQEKINQGSAQQRSVIMLSALTGLPPFYLINIICGTLRTSFNNFFWLGLAGTFIRFSVIAFVPAVAIHYLAK